MSYFCSEINDFKTIYLELILNKTVIIKEMNLIKNIAKSSFEETKN